MQNPVVYQKMKRIAGSLHSLRYYNGYTHEQLPNILKNQELGVVPVLWEDNMPQIAIELAAQGIPVLASSFGGASELTSSEYFCFNGGDHDDFLSHLLLLLHNKKLLSSFWDDRLVLPTVEQHVRKLIKYYKGNNL